MKIRFDSREDRDVALSLCRGLFEESRFRNRKLDEAKTLGAIDAVLANPAQACILLAQASNGEAVGILAGHAQEYFFCEGVIVQDRCFYVKPEFRGTSAAVKLLIAFRKWAELRKAGELCINMSVAIDVARFNKLMVHLGFKYCGSNFSLLLRN